MSKSAREIEVEVDLALARCKSLSAEGLWRNMRYVIETESKRPGHLQQNGSPMTIDMLATRAGCSIDKATRLLQRLEVFGLVKTAKDGSILAPHLAALSRENGRVAAKSARYRDRKKAGVEVGGDITPKRGLHHPDVTPGVTTGPPPDGFSPFTPSSLSPSQNTHTGGDEKENVGGDDLDRRIRAFIRDEPGVLFSPMAHSRMRRSVEKVGWDRYVSALRDAVKRGKGEPFSYAETTAISVKNRIDDAPKPRSAIAVREDN